MSKIIKEVTGLRDRNSVYQAQVFSAPIFGSLQKGIIQVCQAVHGQLEYFIVKVCESGCLFHFHAEISERVLMKLYSNIAYTSQLHIGYNICKQFV